jgi:hypothetical protein
LTTILCMYLLSEQFYPIFKSNYEIHHFLNLEKKQIWKDVVFLNF